MSVNLADAGGDRWLSLIRQLQDDPNFRAVIEHGSVEVAQEQLTRRMQLVKSDGFPALRVIGLLRHPSMRELCTQFCNNGVGRQLFRVQTFTKLKESQVQGVSAAAPKNLTRMVQPD